MARSVYDRITLPASTWEQPDVLDVLARRDVGHLFRIVQKATGATQTQIGIATGLSQAQVSEVMSGSRKITSVEVLARIVTGLRIADPARMTLMLGQRQPTPPAPPRHAIPPEAIGQLGSQRFADVTAIFPSRSAFASAMPVHTLFDQAKSIRAAGLSLNLLCQQYSDTGLTQLVANGTQLHCLLLDPRGEAIKRREREERYEPGFLSSLNDLNIGVLRRVQDGLPDHARGNMQVALYDETVRFNIFMIDETLCVVQPYLPHSRGVDSPTFVIERQTDQLGLYSMFEQVYTSIWEGSRLL